MYKSKSLQDLNLIDSFLFSASTENPQDAEFIENLQRVAGVHIHLDSYGRPIWREPNVIYGKKQSGRSIRERI